MEPQSSKTPFERLIEVGLRMLSRVVKYPQLGALTPKTSTTKFGSFMSTVASSILRVFGTSPLVRHGTRILEAAHEACYPSQFRDRKVEMIQNPIIEWLLPSWKDLPLATDGIPNVERLARIYVNFLFLGNPLGVEMISHLDDTELAEAFHCLDAGSLNEYPPEVLAEIVPRVNGYVVAIREALRGESIRIFNRNGTLTIGEARFIELVKTQSSPLAEDFIRDLIELDPVVWIELVRCSLFHHEYTPEILYEIYLTFKTCLKSTHNPDILPKVIVGLYSAFYTTFEVSFPLPMWLTHFKEGPEYAHQILKAWKLDQWEADDPLTAYCFFKAVLFTYDETREYNEDLTKVHIAAFITQTLKSIFPENALLDALYTEYSGKIERVILRHDSTVRRDVITLLSEALARIGMILNRGHQHMCGSQILRDWLIEYLDVNETCQVNLRPIFAALFDPMNLKYLAKMYLTYTFSRYEKMYPGHEYIKFAAKFRFDLIYDALACLLEVYTGKIIVSHLNPEWDRVLKILVHWMTFIPDSVLEFRCLRSQGLTAPEFYYLMGAIDPQKEVKDSHLIERNPEIINMFYLARSGAYLAINLFKQIITKSQACSSLSIFDAVADAGETLLGILAQRPPTEKFIRLVKRTVPMAGEYVDHIITMKDLSDMCAALLPSNDFNRMIPIVSYFVTLVKGS